MQDHRKQYRVPSSGNDELTVAIGTGPEDQVPTRVLDLSVGGLRLSVDRDAPEPLRLGRTVYTYLTSPHLEAPITVPALVCDQSENGDSVEYRLQFADWLGLLANLPPRLSCLFNKRRDRRFMQSPTQQVEVTVQPTADPDRSVRALLCDLSGSGISFLAEPSAENVLAMVRKVTVSFSLPGVEKEFQFFTRIRHRNLVGEHICYGVYFDEERTPRFVEQQGALESYIDERWSVALRSLVT